MITEWFIIFYLGKPWKAHQFPRFKAVKLSKNTDYQLRSLNGSGKSECGVIRIIVFGFTKLKNGVWCSCDTEIWIHQINWWVRKSTQVIKENEWKKVSHCFFFISISTQKLIPGYTCVLLSNKLLLCLQWLYWTVIIITRKSEMVSDFYFIIYLIDQ